jgi:CheY-like chemotaxis protein
MRNILLVEDEQLFAQLLGGCFEQMGGYNVVMTSTGLEALNVIKQEQFDLVIVDINLPEMSGKDFLRRLRSFDDETGVIVMTGYASPEEIVEFDALNIEDLMFKTDCNINHVKNVVDRYFLRKEAGFLGGPVEVEELGGF